MRGGISVSKRPRGMRREERDGEYPHFDPEEYLFRRVPLILWPSADDLVEVDAVELPDMSVGRSRMGASSPRTACRG